MMKLSNNKIITLKPSGYYEITLWRDCFGNYLCRVWFGYDYVEGISKNKFTACRNAIRIANDIFKLTKTPAAI